jgi:hypothetical protein
MRTWTAHTTINAEPHDVLETLTAVEAIRRWAPVDFDVDELEGDRLVAGSRARVVGKLAGVKVGFDVDVLQADAERLALTCDGPIGMHVEYELLAADTGSDVTASVSIKRGSGFTGRLLAQATETLLAGGVLNTAVSRIGREVEASRPELALAA